MDETQILAAYAAHLETEVRLRYAAMYFSEREARRRIELRNANTPVETQEQFVERMFAALQHDFAERYET